MEYELLGDATESDMLQELDRRGIKACLVDLSTPLKPVLHVPPTMDEMEMEATLVCLAMEFVPPIGEFIRSLRSEGRELHPITLEDVCLLLQRDKQHPTVLVKLKPELPSQN